MSFQRYELKELIYEEFDGAKSGSLGLENFRETYSYKFLNPNDRGDTQEMDFIADIGQRQDEMSLAYIRIVLRVYFHKSKELDLEDVIEDDLKILLNLYVFPRLKTMVSSITDQSTKLMPYFIRPIFKLEEIEEEV